MDLCDKKKSVGILNQESVSWVTCANWTVSFRNSNDRMPSQSLIKVEVFFSSCNTSFMVLNSIAKKLTSICFSLAISLSLFKVTYGGFSYLKPSDTSFVQGDSVAGYLGKLFYLSDGWRFPIGLNPTYGLEFSQPVSLSAGTSYLLFIEKVLGLNPEFQLYGITILIFFCLQHHFGRKILDFLGYKLIQQNIGACLFFTPFLIFKTQLHPLSASVFWPILWAFLIVIKTLKKRRYFFTESVILVFCSYLIFINLCLLVIIVLLLSASQRINIHQLRNIAENKQTYCYAVSIATIPLISAIFIDGFFSANSTSILKSFSIARKDGYGVYNFNLFSLFNPDTGIRDNWYFKPGVGNVEGWSYNMSSTSVSLGMTYGSYEGFAYLGLGVLVLAVTVFWRNHRNLGSYIRSSLTLPTKLLLLFVFIYTLGIPRLTIGMLDFPPMRVRNWLKFFEPIPGFPSSGRAISIFAFGIMIVAFAYLAREKNKALISLALCTCLVVQVLDLTGPLAMRYSYAHDRSKNQVKLLPVPNELRLMAAQKRYMRIFPVENQTSDYDQISYWAWRLGLETNAIYFPRYDFALAKEVEEIDFQAICEGNLREDVIYAIEKSPRGIEKFASCELTNLRKWEYESRIFISKT